MPPQIIPTDFISLILPSAGQSTKGEAHTLYGELIAVRESLHSPPSSPERFSVVPADLLLDLPNHPSPPSLLEQPDPSE